jgi:hypothetical protein
MEIKNGSRSGDHEGTQFFFLFGHGQDIMYKAKMRIAGIPLAYISINLLIN